MRTIELYGGPEDGLQISVPEEVDGMICLEPVNRPDRQYLYVHREDGRWHYAGWVPAAV